jgi:hypothetical protein
MSIECYLILCRPPLVALPTKILCLRFRKPLLGEVRPLIYAVSTDLTQSPAPESTQPPAFGTTSTYSNPFSDSHETSSMADVDVDNLDRVEMSIFQSEATGGQLIIPVVALVMSLTMSPEAAVVLGLHGRDGSTQEVAGTIPFAIGSDSSDRTDERGERLPCVKLVCD